jgi:hypothetical protein
LTAAPRGDMLSEVVPGVRKGSHQCGSENRTALLEKLVADGRSTPGARQENDVPVNGRRFLDEAVPRGKFERRGPP